MVVRLKTKIGYWLSKQYMKSYGMFHPVKKQILFKSFAGKQYSDNPRAISEKMHEMYPDYKIIWSLKHNDNKYGLIPDYVETVPAEGNKFCEALATSFCFVTNEDLSPGIYKRKNQFFVQTWHGDRTAKKVLYDAYENGNRPIPVMDEYYTDLCIAASDYGEKTYRTAFRYKGDVLKVGMPRNDKLINRSKSEVEIIRRRFNLLSDEKILLYAPTFRDNQKEKQNVLIDLKQVIDILSQNNEKWCCMIRAHSASCGLNINCDGKHFIDVSDYPDMADLLLVSEMLITDYSSSSGDFILLNRPVILTIFDEDDYTQKCRSFSFSWESAGFMIARSQEHLNKIIQEMNQDDIKRNCERVMKFFNVSETGKSSEVICQIINEKYLDRFVRSKIYE